MLWLEKLNQMKKKTGMTTDEISEKSKVPKGTLNKLFAGQTKDPQLGTIKAVVHCMGYTLDDLDDGADEMEKATPNTNVSEEAVLNDATEMYEIVNKFAVEHNIDQKRIEKAIRILEILLFDD